MAASWFYTSFPFCCLDYAASKGCYLWTMNLKACERNVLIVKWRYCMSILLRKLRVTTKDISQNSRFPGGGLNPELHGIWTRRVTHSTVRVDDLGVEIWSLDLPKTKRSRSRDFNPELPKYKATELPHTTFDLDCWWKENIVLVSIQRTYCWANPPHFGRHRPVILTEITRPVTKAAVFCSAFNLHPFQ
jgi:hypothetical protein